MPEHDSQNINITVVVSGQPESVRVNVHQTLEHLVREALQQSGNQGQPPEEWELRREDGSLLALDGRVGDTIEDGATLFLNPKAGAGGSW